MKKTFAYLLFLIAVIIVLIITMENDKPVGQPDVPKIESDSAVKRTPEEMPVKLRMKIYYELAEYQDRVPYDHPQKTDHDAKSYDVISRKYQISIEKLKQIVAEGSMKKWALPPAPE